MVVVALSLFPMGMLVMVVSLGVVVGVVVSVVVVFGGGGGGDGGSQW